MAAPAPAVWAPGVGAVSADNLNTFVQGGLLLASLRAFQGGWNGQLVYLVGFTSPGDGGQGGFWWNATSAAADNGTTVIVPNGVLAGYGAWLRVLESGAYYPTTNPGAGSGLIWNNGGFLCVA